MQQQGLPTYLFPAGSNKTSLMSLELDHNGNFRLTETELLEEPSAAKGKKMHQHGLPT